MREKGKAPQGRAERLKIGQINRADQSQPQYNHTARNPKQPLTDRQFQQILIDLWCAFSGGLLQPKFSYFVGRDGRLIVRSARRAGV